MKTYIISEHTVYTFLVEYTVDYKEVSTVLSMFDPQTTFDLENNLVTVHDATVSELDEILRELARIHDK